MVPVGFDVNLIQCQMILMGYYVILNRMWYYFSRVSQYCDRVSSDFDGMSCYCNRISYNIDRTSFDCNKIQKEFKEFYMHVAELHMNSTGLGMILPEFH